MNVQAQSTAAKPAYRLPLAAFFSDLRVRYGIKLGLAGILALYMSQLLRLEHPNWSILSVVVMMNSQYVGATSIKAIMRVVGTIGGALLGVWLVGTYVTEPVFFVAIAFVVITIATYKFGQFPASQTPYAYFLVGNTLIAVITYALSDPNDVWEIGISRALETLTGVVASLIVGSIVWPRYAREEFFGATHSALGAIRNLLSEEMSAYLNHTKLSEEHLEQVKIVYIERLSAMRNLFRAGARESTYFRTHAGNYNAAITALSNMFQSAVGLQRWPPGEVPLLDQIRPEFEAFAAAVAEEFELLEKARYQAGAIPVSQLGTAFDSLQTKVNGMRDDGTFLAQTPEVSVSFLGHFAALRQIRRDLEIIRGALLNLPRLGQPPPPRKRAWELLPRIDPFWLKAGLKGGLAVAIAFLLMEWINPPGSGALPLSAWLFVIGGRGFIRAGWPGDRRAFWNVAEVALVGAAAFAGLLLLLPFLANYALMNLTLFVLLFLFGFYTARIQGLNFWMLVGIIGFSVFVALNPQVPVPTSTIFNSILGLLTGLTIASLVGRLIWPVLPQRMLRDDQLEFIQGLKAILTGDPALERMQLQLVVLPVEARQSARLIHVQQDSALEKDKLERMIRAFQAIGAQLKWLVELRSDLPAEVEPVIRPRLAEMETEFMQILDTFEECFRNGDCRRSFPTMTGTEEALLGAIKEVRDSCILQGEGFDVVVRVVDVVNRYLITAEAFQECIERVKALRIDRYWGDWSL